MPKVFLESVARQDPWYAKDLVWFMVIFVIKTVSNSVVLLASTTNRLINEPSI